MCTFVHLVQITVLICLSHQLNGTDVYQSILYICMCIYIDLSVCISVLDERSRHPLSMTSIRSAVMTSKQLLQLLLSFEFLHTIHTRLQYI